jgi:outer membrane protein assembly factor BamB
MQGKGHLITNGESSTLKVYDANNIHLPTQTIQVKKLINCGLFVDPDTLYIGCDGGHLYIFKIKDSQL